MEIEKVHELGFKPDGTIIIIRDLGSYMDIAYFAAGEIWLNIEQAALACKLGWIETDKRNEESGLVVCSRLASGSRERQPDDPPAGAKNPGGHL